MAKPSLFRDRKFLLLCALIGDEARALGCLEYLWHLARETGDVVIGPPAVVEHAARWRGAPGVLAAALLEAGFVVETQNGLAIHDLADHMPDYGRGRTTAMRRSPSAKNGGQSPLFPEDAAAQGAAGESRKRTDRPSSIEEVREYLAELGVQTFTAEQFVDWYEVRGWRLKSGPVKDWRACVRTWIRRDAASPAAARKPRVGEYVEGRCAECGRPSPLVICEACQRRVWDDAATGEKSDARKLEVS